VSSSTLIRWGGLAAMVGGLMWVLKGGGILLTDQREAVGDPDRVGRAGVDAARLFGVGSQGRSDGPTT
jgi:hypothetical protein